jgi:hypothetical protein
MARRPRTRGFWRGLFAGLLLALVAMLALAWFFPPLQPPEVTPESLSAPPAPEAPAGVAEPTVPAPQGLLPEPPRAPLIEGLAAPEAAPALPEGGAGSPSLVPPAAD